MLPIYIYLLLIKVSGVFNHFPSFIFLSNIPLEYESNRLVCELLCYTRIKIFFMSNSIQLYVRYVKLIFAIIRPKIIVVFFNFGSLLFLTWSSYFSRKGMHYNMIYWEDFNYHEMMVLYKYTPLSSLQQAKCCWCSKSTWIRNISQI